MFISKKSGWSLGLRDEQLRLYFNRYFPLSLSQMKTEEKRKKTVYIFLQQSPELFYYWGISVILVFLNSACFFFLLEIKISSLHSIYFNVVVEECFLVSHGKNKLGGIKLLSLLLSITLLLLLQHFRKIRTYELLTIWCCCCGHCSCPWEMG